MSPKREKKHCQTIRQNAGVKGVTYTAIYELPPDPKTGKRRQKSLGTYASRKEANDACAERAEAERTGKAVDPSKMTFADLTERWLTEEATLSVRPQTLEDYEATIRNHVLPRLGKQRAQGLIVSDISAFRASVLDATGCRSTQLALLRVKQILAWAHRLELVGRNVAEGIPPPNCTVEEGYAMSDEEVRRFLTASYSDTYSPLWLLYLTSGFRRGEGLGLRWRDVDWTRSTLTVKQQVVVRGGAPVIGEPKSKAAKRTIEMDPHTMGQLETHYTKQCARRKEARYWQDYDLVFCTGGGTPINPNNLYRNFARIVEASGVHAELKPHDLRHTHGTRMLNAGMTIADLSRRLGHAKVSITVDLYASHLVAGRESGAPKAISEMLFPEKL